MAAATKRVYGAQKLDTTTTLNTKQQAAQGLANLKLYKQFSDGGIANPTPTDIQEALRTPGAPNPPPGGYLTPAESAGIMNAVPEPPGGYKTSPEEKKEEEKDVPASKQVKQAADYLKSFGKISAKFNSNIRGLPVVGSITFPLLLVLFLLFFVVPVNGKTRAEWFWAVLIGEAKLPVNTSYDPITGESAGQAAEVTGGSLYGTDTTAVQVASSPRGTLVSAPPIGGSSSAWIATYDPSQLMSFGGT